MSNTAEDVFAVKLATERGDVLRVYTFERISGAVWQVDMLAGNGSFWVHPKITNPGKSSMMGYWWTNVGVNVDASGEDAVRLLTPATHWVSDSTGAAHPPWPFFHERQGLGLGSWTHNESLGDWAYPNYPGYEVMGQKVDAVPIDHSYNFLWWEKRDVWYDLVHDKRKVRYNGWVDKHGGFMVHGHPNNGTKAWIWGRSPVEQFWQNFGGGTKQNNLYTELQTGVMPTQYQGFPIDAGDTREWTEYFTTATLQNDSSASSMMKKLFSQDYHGIAINTIDKFLAEKSIGGSGDDTEDTAIFDDVDDFMTTLADRRPFESDILHYGLGWGALEELLLKQDLTPGSLFPSLTNQTLSRETRPWWELVRFGKFSSHTLGSHVTSFQTTDRWLDLLFTSMKTNGETWLHHLHIGIALLNRCIIPGDGNMTKAKTHFDASMNLNETPEAMRNLAIIAHSAGDHSSAFDLYTSALKMLTTQNSLDPLGAKMLLRDMAAESTYQFALLGMTNYTKILTNSDSIIPSDVRYTDRFRFAEVQASYGMQDWETFFKLCDCSKDRLWPALGWYGGGTAVLLQWYQSAILLRKEAELHRPLTQLETNAEIRANPVPFCLRAVGH